jgi:hypothetical protein
MNTNNNAEETNSLFIIYLFLLNVDGAKVDLFNEKRLKRLTGLSSRPETRPEA